MKKQRILALGLAAVLCASALTGCGSGTSDTSSDTSADTSTDTSADTATSDDGSLVIAMDADVSTLHPSDYSTTVELNILNQIYDSLIYMNPDGTEEPEARLAERYEVSDDGLTYTFYLRDDITFHDGTAITADDVVFSLELYQDSEYQNTYVTGLDYAEALDETTVVCYLETPYAPFLLGISFVHIASKDYYESSPEEFASNPIGSGAYQFESRTKGSNVVLSAYEGYYRGVASISQVTFEVVPSQSTMAVALQTGEIGFAEIEATNLSQLEGVEGITTQEVSTSNFVYVTMNLEQEPFDNVLVRQAINYAINRENIVLVCYEGAATVNSSICSPERLGYSDELFQYEYDPDKAMELLAEAGIETPYDLGEILVSESSADLATVLQSDLSAVGLEVTISTKEFNAYISDLTSGSYGISALSMTLDGDTQMLEMAFCTDYIGTANNARYSDSEMDALFDQARTETDSDKRAEILFEALEKAQEEAIYAAICNPVTIFAYNSDLQVPEIAYEGIYFLYDFSW